MWVVNRSDRDVPGITETFFFNGILIVAPPTILWFEIFQFHELFYLKHCLPNTVRATSESPAWEGIQRDRENNNIQNKKNYYR